MANLTQETAERILNSRIEVPNNFSGKIGNVEVTHVQENYIDSEGREKTIINFKASSTHGLDEAFEMLSAGDIDASVKKSMSVSYLLPTNKYIPSKGEFVDLVITQEPRKDGSGTFPAVKSVIEQKAVVLTTRKRSVTPIAEQEETLEDVIGKKK